MATRTCRVCGKSFKHRLFGGKRVCSVCERKRKAVPLESDDGGLLGSIASMVGHSEGGPSASAVQNVEPAPTLETGGGSFGGAGASASFDISESESSSSDTGSSFDTGGGSDGDAGGGEGNGS